MLTVEDLSKSYPGPVEALKSVTLELGRGAFGLLGPNGAGKTTLMRTLATLQLPDSGRVKLGELDLVANPHAARQRIGYLPQEMGCYPRVTAREMLDYLAALRGIGPKREREQLVARWLGRVNLTDDADRRIETYSGGMRQRFGIASAFLAAPDLVIIDEPTAGLDPTERRRFQCLLAEAAQDCVMMISSHIVEDIAGLCDEMAILSRGEVVLRGSPDELTREIEGRVWTKRSAYGELGALQEQRRVLSWRPEAGRLAVRVLAQGGQEAALRGEGFQPAGADLEDLYSLHANAHGSNY
ncbi:MAG: ATP-binding cassette domain-containing protein [Planctomycetota bacterium]